MPESEISTAKEVAELSEAQNRSTFWGTMLAIPMAFVGGWLVQLLVDAPTNDIWVWVVLAVTIVVDGVVLPFRFARWLIDRASARNSTDQPGARLHRMLMLPRELTVWTVLPVWLLGAAIFATFVVVRHDKPWWIVPLAMVIGFGAYLMTSIPGTIINERHFRKFAIAEFQHNPTVKPRGKGLMWTRKSWNLPYVFTALLMTMLTFMSVIVAVKFLRLEQTMTEDLSKGGHTALATEFHEQAMALLLDMGVSAIAVTLVMLLTGVMTAWLMGRTEREAADAIRTSLEQLRDGQPRPPEFISTDETGDVAAAVAAVSVDVGQLYEKLQAVAAGDLSVQLTGDSGLARAFRESQVALLALTEKMLLLSRGEMVEAGDLSGDLGNAFERLTEALTGTIQQAKTIAEGDLRRDVDASGTLGAALDRMTKNLRGMVGNMQETGGRLSESVVSLRATASQLSAAATEQVTALTETANTMTEMSQTSAVSADRAVELIKQGEAASEVVEEGRKGATSAISAMGDISKSLSKVANASSVLAERVQRIDSIIETVGFLADQSSTLAINAGIEASRAGEAGRGFAAVAREMRSLASDSRKATTQIREILSELRQKTVQVDAQVTEGTKTVEAGSEEVSKLSEVVEQLGVTIHEAVGLMRQVEGSARQHQAGVSQVSQALSSMQSASQAIRDGARHLSELSESAMEMSSQLKATAGAYELPQIG